MRFSNFLKSQAAQMTSPAPFRLTPGQLELLSRETGNPRPTKFVTPLGTHEIQPIYCATRAIGDNVILAPREDLFIESENAEGVRLVSVANEVTSVPDNIACVEVISAGEFAEGIHAGDLVFIDFYRVKQGYVIENEELYIAGADAFAAKFDNAKGEIVPLDNYVTTRRCVDRFRVAVNGVTANEYMTDARVLEGIVSGRTSKGTAAAHTVYEEVVAVGKLTKRPRPGVTTPAERAVLEIVARGDLGGYGWAEYDGVDAEEAEVFNAYRKELLEGRTPDIQPGMLVAFCKEIATQLRVRGEFRSLIPYDNILAEIDDQAIRAEAERKRLASDKPRLVIVGG